MKKQLCITALIVGFISSQALASVDQIILETQDNWSSYYYCTTPSTAKNLSRFSWTSVNVPQQKIVWYNGTTGDPCSTGTQINCPTPKDPTKVKSGYFFVDNSRNACVPCPNDKSILACETPPSAQA